jgi:glutathione peroxidase
MKKGQGMRALAALLVAAFPGVAIAGYSFPSIDGGTIDLADLRGKPVLVVNTASLCGFAPQYDDLQALQDRFAGRLTVLAVPSDDFGQELADGEEVAEFCAVNFDLTIPMTDITPVTGPDAHPFYVWMRAEHGFTPRWNFNKILLDADGTPVATWGSVTRPTSRAIITAIEAAIP